MRLSFLIPITFLLSALAAPSPVDDAPSATAAASVPLSTACGDIVNNKTQFVFPAKKAYECLTSVPFNPAVATRFLKYWNDTLQFQSTIAYLKDPPSSYQQPPVDLFGEVAKIQQGIDDGIFPNQYAFEATLQNLIYSAHDLHLNLEAGILAAFTFASPYGIASVSKDGIEIPKVYYIDDLLETQGNTKIWEPSAIAKINDQSVNAYLEDFAGLNAIGNVEPHADWNQLMSSPALDIQDLYSIFEGYTTFYPGENITLTFENGTRLGPEPWVAIYNSQGETGPLATGGDFFNFFVLGLYPASLNVSTESDEESGSGQNVSTVASPTNQTDATVASNATSAVPSPSSWNNAAYPAIPDVAQADLGASGVLTGYFLADISTAVLSIPSFLAFGDAVVTFSDTIGEFLMRSQKAGMKKVVIDVQQNSGGINLLAIDAYKQFFPQSDPYGGSRIRAHPAADVLGTTFTQYFEGPDLNASYYNALAVEDWVSSARLDAATGKNFTSWGEFFGPHFIHDDHFTTVQRRNLSSIIYDVVASGGVVVYGYGDRTPAPSAPYAAEDIIILTDALCSSACSIFLELMHHEAGVRTVVVGGQPSHGPMQAPSGSRGAELYAVEDLDTDFDIAEALNATTTALLPPRAEDVYVLYAGINLRDQIRKDQDTPLQFLYEAADCRIYFTPQTFWNFTNLWKYAAKAAWENPQLCVEGSTGFASKPTADPTVGPPRTPSNGNSRISYNISDILYLSTQADAFHAGFGGQELDARVVGQAQTGDKCNPNSGCQGGRLNCQAINFCGSTSNRCVQPCTTSDRFACGGQGNCYAPRAGGDDFQFGRHALGSGFCPLQARCTPSGPDFTDPNNAPLPPGLFTKGGGGGRSRGSEGGEGRGGEGSPSRKSYLARGSLGNKIMGGLTA